MTLLDDLRTELGIDRLEEQQDRIIALLEAMQATQPFYTVPEAAKVLRKRKAEVEKLIDAGVLWIVEGLGSSVRLIPQAALDELQRRPRHLEAVKETA